MFLQKNSFGVVLFLPIKIPTWWAISSMLECALKCPIGLEYLTSCKPEEGEDNVKSTCPLHSRQHTYYNGLNRESQPARASQPPKIYLLLYYYIYNLLKYELRTQVVLLEHYKEPLCIKSQSIIFSSPVANARALSTCHHL